MGDRLTNFSYKAVDKTGKTVNGVEEAPNKQVLFSSLKTKGLTPINATEVKGRQARVKDNNNSSNNKPQKQRQTLSERFSQMSFEDLGKMDIIPQKITSKDYSVFCRQAYTMLNAGMNIITTLQVLSVQIENKRLKETTGKVLIELQKGYPLSTCLRLYPKVYPTLFVNMVESGELTGNLDGVLDSLASYYERESEINRQVNAATLYPKAVGVIAIIVVMALLMFVVPTFVTMFEDSDTPLPMMTQHLIAMSEFVQAKWYFVIGFFVIIAFLFGQIKKYDTSRYYYDVVINKTPVVGKAVVKITTARFSRTTATLLQSGIPIIAAIKSASQVADNTIISRGIDKISDDIRAGQNLSVMLGTLNYFPPMMVSMVSIGEESGDMVGLLDKTADYYEEEMKEAIDTLTGLIEPVMIVFLAITVGYVVIAILLPVLDMAKTVQM